jgi:hypothetical protein
MLDPCLFPDYPYYPDRYNFHLQGFATYKGILLTWYPDFGGWVVKFAYRKVWALRWSMAFVVATVEIDRKMY